MRSSLLLFLFGLFFLLGSSQIVITSDDLPSPVGSSYVLHSVIPAPEIVMSGGLLWDFSGLSISNSHAVNVIQTEESPFGDLFSESSLCYLLGGGNYLYAKKTEASYLKYGGVAKSTQLVMKDPSVFLEFPLQKGRQWTDSLNSTFHSKGMRFDRTGMIEGQVIGEGTLLMPYGSVQDVLRISLEEELSDAYSVIGNPLFLKTTNRIECFVKAGNSEPLLTWTRVIKDGKQISSFLSYVDGNYVSGKGSDGPWNSFAFEDASDTSSTRFEFISEWRGILTLEYFSPSGAILKTEELTTKPGLMNLEVELLQGRKYLRISTEEQSFTLALPTSDD